MKTFWVKWIAGGIISTTRIEALDAKDAMRRFYAMASDRAVILEVS